MKKMLCFVLCAVMMLTLFVPCFAQETETIKIRVSNSGSSAGNKRIIAREDSADFDVTEVNQLVGWVINGTMTYNGTGEYSKSVVFKDVEILKSDARDGGAFAMDFKIPDGYTICENNSEDKNMVWDLTITGVEKATSAPEKEEEKPVTTTSSFKLKDGEQLLFIKADDFKDDLGRWVSKGATSGSVLPVLEATPVNSGSDVPANTTVKIEKAGKYYVHVSALDYATNQPATRFFNVAVNDQILPEKAGTHKQDGWRWQLAGEIDLGAGEAKVSIVDTANFFGRCQGIILTTDKDFSGPSDDEMFKVSNEYGIGEKIETVVPTNKLGKAVMLFLGSPKAYVMGKETKVDVNNDTVVPFTENDRTLVPVRFIAESFGALVGWDDATQTVTVEANGKVIKMVLGQAEMDVDGNKVVLDTPANTYNDRTFIPLRAMAEAINKKVFWDDRGLILISDLTFDAKGDKDLIEKAYNGFNGETIDFSPIKEDLSQYVSKIGDVDYMLDLFYPAEFKERNGLVNTIAKLKKGEKVTIGFFGGSISEQDGWRPRTVEWLRAQYPEAEIEEINLTLGATKSDLAACRVTEYLLPLNPDLVFFEYAVNGGNGAQAEGFVRNVWSANPKTDICFVYTLRADYAKSYSAMIPSENEYAFDEVAEYYGIPAISFGFQIADFYNSGKLTLAANTLEEGKILFTQDNVHPTMEGSNLYAGAVARALATLDKRTVTEEFVHEIKEPLFENNWNDGKVYDYTVAEFEGDWQELTHNGEDFGDFFPYKNESVKSYGKMFPTLMGTKTPGASFTVKFTGRAIGLYDFGGPFSGQFIVTVDDGEPFVVSRHTIYGDHVRNQYVFLPELPYGEHTVTFTLDSTVPDKTAMSDYEERKDEYEQTQVYLSKILIVGEIK